MNLVNLNVESVHFSVIRSSVHVFKSQSVTQQNGAESRPGRDRSGDGSPVQGQGEHWGRPPHTHQHPTTHPTLRCAFSVNAKTLVIQKKTKQMFIS